MHQNDVDSRQVLLKPIIRDVAAEVVSIWQTASIPCWGVDYTEKRLLKMWEGKRKIAKSRKNLTVETAKDMDRLLDISQKQSAPELKEDSEFLKDQRRQRVMHIGPSLDRQTTERWRRQQQRRQRAEREAPTAASAGNHDATAARAPTAARPGRRASSEYRPPVRRSVPGSGSLHGMQCK